MSRNLKSLEDTAGFARALAGVLKPGDLVRLDGPLGAGKTTLTRALARAMGIGPEMVSSPTFVIVNVYENDRGPDLVHADAYRLGDPEELDGVGWDRLVSGDAVVVVEWGARIADALEGACVIELEPVGETARAVRIEAPAGWSARDGFASLGAPDTTARHDTVCRVTGRPVPAASPTWPFADERARMADLHGWFSGAHTITRPIEQADLEQGE